MSGMDRHSEPQQHKTAAEYRQAADEHVRTLKDFWKDCLVSGLFVLAAIVAIFACLAWFAANNRVSATGSGISANGPRFVLSGTQDGTAGKYDSQDDYTTDSTSLAVNNLFNLNNMSADGSLSPGSAGQLQLNVKPLCNDLHDITVEMTWEISVQTNAVGTGGTAADASKNETIINSLKDLVRGHILVFQDKDASGFYSNPLVPTTTAVTQDGASVTVITQRFTIPAASFCAKDSNNTTETVTKALYWIWPEQFKSYVRTGNAGYGGNLFASTDTAGYTALVGNINNNHARYFRADSSSVPGQAPGTVPTVETNMSSANVEACASYYNNADEVIGKNIQYIRVRFTAKEADK